MLCPLFSAGAVLFLLEFDRLAHRVLIVGTPLDVLLQIPLVLYGDNLPAPILLTLVVLVNLLPLRIPEVYLEKSRIVYLGYEAWWGT